MLIGCVLFLFGPYVLMDGQLDVDLAIDQWTRQLKAISLAEIHYQSGLYGQGLQKISVVEFESDLRDFAKRSSFGIGEIEAMAVRWVNPSSGASTLLSPCAMWIDGGRIAVDDWRGYEVMDDEHHIVQREAQFQVDIFPIGASSYTHISLTDLRLVPMHVPNNLVAEDVSSGDGLRLKYVPSELPQILLDQLGVQQPGRDVAGWTYELDQESMMVRYYCRRGLVGEVLEFVYQDGFVEYSEGAILPTIFVRGKFGADGFLSTVWLSTITDATINQSIPKSTQFEVPVMAGQVVVDHRASLGPFYAARSVESVLKAQPAVEVTARNGTAVSGRHGLSVWNLIVAANIIFVTLIMLRRVQLKVARNRNSNSQ